MSRAVVLDSSALLCLLNGEAGAGRVAEVLHAAVIGAVNLAEVVTRLGKRGLSAEPIQEALGGFKGHPVESASRNTDRRGSVISSPLPPQRRTAQSRLTLWLAHRSE